MEKIRLLVKNICEYSLDLKENERIYIHYESRECNPLVKEIIKLASKMNCFVYEELVDREISSLKKSMMPNNLISNMKYLEEEKIKYFDAFIYIKYSENDYESKIIDKDKLQEISKALENSVNVRSNEKKWVLLNYPSKLDAHKAKMNTLEFYDFALDAMTIDYKDVCNNLRPLKDLMEKTDKVRIVGPNTDISFSIKNMNAIPCCGEKNIPDGELYTAPIKTSVNGTITYNTPSPYMGCVYNNVSLTFKDGKIIKASSDEEEDLLSSVFSIDDGAKYVGEFSLGFNKVITKPMGDILFDEKIYGSLHFTPGASYKDAYNGNDSSLHWDLVLIQTKEYGGGEIYFDDILVRKDGLFTLPDLKQLN